MGQSSEIQPTCIKHIRISQSLPQLTVAPKPIDRAIRFYQYTPLGHLLLLSLQKPQLPLPVPGLQMTEKHWLEQIFAFFVDFFLLVFFISFKGPVSGDTSSMS